MKRHSEQLSRRGAEQVEHCRAAALPQPAAGHASGHAAATAYPHLHPPPHDAVSKENRPSRVPGKTGAPLPSHATVEDRSGSHRHGEHLAAECARPCGAPASSKPSSAPEPAVGPTRWHAGWTISEEQMHQPWGTVLRSLARPQ